MKFFTVSRCCMWVLLFTLVACQPDREERFVAFSTYLEQEKLWAEAEDLYSQGQWELARKQYARIFLVEREAVAELRQAACLLQQGHTQEARTAMAAAIRLGASREALSDPVFARLGNACDSLYQEQHPSYWESLDSPFRNELENLLQQGASFSEQLRALTETRGWPDCWELGCHDDLFSRLALRLSEGSEADNRFFLNLMVEAASHNRASWHDAQILMKNLCTAYLDEDESRIRLWGISLTPEGRLDRERSLLQLSTLAETFQNQVLYLELYAPSFPKEETPATRIGVLDDIREQLISLGLDSRLVGVNPYPVAEKTSDGDFFLVGMTVAR